MFGKSSVRVCSSCDALELIHVGFRNFNKRRTVWIIIKGAPCVELCVVFSPTYHRVLTYRNSLDR